MVGIVAAVIDDHEIELGMLVKLRFKAGKESPEQFRPLVGRNDDAKTRPHFANGPSSDLSWFPQKIRFRKLARLPFNISRSPAHQMGVDIVANDYSRDWWKWTASPAP